MVKPVRKYCSLDNDFIWLKQVAIEQQLNVLLEAGRNLNAALKRAR